jgi:hypothetical protein
VKSKMKVVSGQWSANDRTFRFFRGTCCKLYVTARLGSRDASCVRASGRSHSFLRVNKQHPYESFTNAADGQAEA